MILSTFWKKNSDNLFFWEFHNSWHTVKHPMTFPGPISSISNPMASPLSMACMHPVHCALSVLCLVSPYPVSPYSVQSSITLPLCAICQCAVRCHHACVGHLSLCCQVSHYHCVICQCAVSCHPANVSSVGAVSSSTPLMCHLSVSRQLSSCQCVICQCVVNCPPANVSSVSEWSIVPLPMCHLSVCC